MAQTLRRFARPVAGRDGNAYAARACAAETSEGLWQGWIEFLPLDGGEAIRSPRETTQPNRVDTEYWAGGLSAVYLEGALDRALNPLRAAPTRPLEPPQFSGPARSVVPREAADSRTESVLNPFSVYKKGEPLLRKQLAALSSWHLVNIIVHYELSDRDPARLNDLPAAALIDCIVAAVRERVPGARTPSHSR